MESNQQLADVQSRVDKQIALLGSKRKRENVDGNNPNDEPKCQEPFNKPFRLLRRMRRKLEMESFALPFDPPIIQEVKQAKMCVNHTYRDLSIVPVATDYQGLPSEISHMTFGEKMHHMLSQEQYHHIISWRPHGRAFFVRNPHWMEETGILQRYFPTAAGNGNGSNPDSNKIRYSAFIRMLSNYGFKQITHGRDRNSYYHECMLRGLPHLCKFLGLPRDARRLKSDPENEPDFYDISRRYPLPVTS